MCKFWIDNLKIRKGIIYIELYGDYNKIDYVNTVLKYRDKLEKNLTAYEFEEKEISNKLFKSLVLDINDKKLISGNWDIKVISRENGVENYYDVSTHLLKDKLVKFFYNEKYTRGNYIFYPYSTINGPFFYREKGKYDGYAFKIKERIAMGLYLLRRKKLEKQNIYIIFEKFSHLAQDNGYYFFKYCMDNNIEEKQGIKIYYIIDRESKDRQNLEKYKDHILDFMSYKHIVYLLCAKLLISSDAKNHSYAYKFVYSRLIWRIRQKKSVFLQHGVTAFKRVDSFYGKGKYGECDWIVATSENEKNIIKNKFNYNDENILVTGFCRWDVLEDKSYNSKEILMMPTWRNWLDNASEEEFRNSNFFKSYSMFIKSENLKFILEKNDIYLNYYLHPKFADYIGEFRDKSDRIKFISLGEEPLNEILMRSKMLITDYSSVSWDMFYQNKPVLFFQFDLDDYNKAHGSYIDMEKDLFGDKASNSEELIRYIDEYAKTNFKVTEKYEEQREKSFKYIDNKNCERLEAYLNKMFTKG